MRIQILVIAGCPHAGAAHDAVSQALVAAGVRACVEEVVVNSPDVPGFAGSPTILVDGRDVEAAGADCSALGCRLYDNPANRGVPAQNAIRKAIERAKEGPATS